MGNDINGVISRYITEEDLEPFDEEFDQGMLLDTIMGLYELLPDNIDLPDDLVDNMGEIFDEFEDEDDDGELDEALPPKRKRKDFAQRRKSRQYYRKNKIRIKRTKKKYERSPAGKRYKRKSKKMSKFGKTATGKRKSVYIN